MMGWVEAVIIGTLVSLSSVFELKDRENPILTLSSFIFLLPIQPMKTLEGFGFTPYSIFNVTSEF